jgi:hypothetical protein
MDHIKLMLGEFNAVLGREHLYKEQLGMTADMTIAVLMVSE